MIKKMNPNDYQEVPWRNGGGLSWNIVMDSAHPEFEQGMFNWRFATARIESDGEFSTYGAIDRTITLLEGDGFELDVIGNHGQTRLSVNKQKIKQTFPGDVLTTCHLENGPVSVLNVMCARGLWKSDVSVTNVDDTVSVNKCGDVLLLFAMEAQVKCSINGELVELSQHEAAVAHSDASTGNVFDIVCESVGGDGKLYMATLWCLKNETSSH